MYVEKMVVDDFSSTHTHIYISTRVYIDRYLYKIGSLCFFIARPFLKEMHFRSNVFFLNLSAGTIYGFLLFDVYGAGTEELT